MALLWVQFAACAAVIVTAGYFLVRFGDAIAELTGLGRLWAGAILIAAATSLPELFTGVGSIVVFDVPDLTVSTLLGSCVVNLLLLVVLDFLAGRRCFFDGVNPAYIVETGFALGLTSLVALGLYLAPVTASFPWVWPGSLLIPILYVAGVHVTMREGRHAPYVQDPTDEKPRRPATRAATLPKAVLGYSVSALLVIGASLWLPGVTERIAERTGIATEAMGGFLVAVITSLPEIVTTVAAFRMRAADIAFSNVMGSNLFNLMILGIDDMLYPRGPITAAVSPGNLGTALIVVAMTAAVIVGLAVRRQRKALRLSWTSAFLGVAAILHVILVLVRS